MAKTKKQGKQQTSQEQSTSSEEKTTTTEESSKPSGKDTSEQESKGISPIIAGVECPVCGKERMKIDLSGNVYCGSCGVNGDWMKKNDDLWDLVEAKKAEIESSRPETMQLEKFPVCGSEAGVDANGNRLECNGRIYRERKTPDGPVVYCTKCGANLDKDRVNDELQLFLDNIGPDISELVNPPLPAPFDEAAAERLKKAE